MGFEAVEPEQRQLLKKALDDARLCVPDVWMQYVSLGGIVGEYEVDAYINGSLSLPPLQRDILAHAANELIDELPPRPRAPYGADVARTQAGGHPLVDGRHPESAEEQGYGNGRGSNPGEG